MSFILRLIALVCFLLAVFGVGFEHVLLVPLGLALWVGSTLIDNPYAGRPV